MSKNMLEDFFVNYNASEIADMRKATVAHLIEKTREIEKLGARIRAAEDQTAKLRKELHALVTQKVDDLEKIHYFDKTLKSRNFELDEDGNIKTD